MQNDNMRGTGSLVWHYTDGLGLKGILANNVLWASSAAYLNDFKELVSGSDRLKEVYGELDEEYAELKEELEKNLAGFATPREENFILSACEHGDSLTMWRYYGRDEVSFAVGLARDVPLGVRAQKKGDSHPFPPPGYKDGPRDPNGQLEWDPDQEGQAVESWDAMVYDPDEQKKILSQALSDLRDAHEQAKRDENKFSFSLYMERLSLLGQLNRIKDYAFRDEQELRTLAEVSPAWKYVLHRPGRYGLIPYIELGIPKGGTRGRGRDFGDGGGPQKMEQLPIRQINIGPTPFPEEARFGLLQLLGFLGYHDVKVEVSSIPYR